KHQIENAKIAVELAKILSAHFYISEAAIHRGLANARHPGRLEYSGDFLFDGAHNVGGALALRDFLEHYEKREINMIFGAMKGKSVAEMAQILFPLAENLVLTKPENSRAIDPAEIAEIIGKDLAGRTVVVSNVKEAVA